MSSSSISYLSAPLLALLSVLGFYTLHIVGSANGLYETIEQYASRRLLSDNVSHWPAWFNPPQYFTLPSALLGFFWPCVEPQNTTLALSSLVFAGQAVAAISLVTVEGYRAGNRGKFVSHSAVYLQIMQFSGFAFSAPLYLVLHLLTSATGTDAAALVLANENGDGIATLRALPLAILTGYILPTVVMALPYPAYLSLDAKVTAILAWQVFPVLVYVSGAVWKFILRSNKDAAATVNAQLGYLRFTYAFALVLSATTHIAVTTLSLAAAIAPGIFTPATAQGIHPLTLFIPHMSPLTRRIEDVAAGSLNFLQWDYAIGSLAHLIWAVTVTMPTGMRGARNVVRRSDFSLGNVFVDVVVRSVFLGPLAAALTLVWERDEAVLGGSSIQTAGVTKGKTN